MNSESRDCRTQASHVLKSYLDSLQIPYSASGHEVLIKARQSEATVRVVVVDSIEGTLPGAVSVRARDLISPEIPRILNAIHTATVAAGYGRPNPLDRGVMPTRRLSYHDDYEDVYLRGKLLFRTPTPSAEGMQKILAHMPIIKKAATKAFFKFRYAFEAMGIGEDDLINIGRVHAVTFFHHYAYEAGTQDNIALLAEFCNQRFAELAKVTSKKAQSSQFTPFSSLVRAEGDRDEGSSMNVSEDLGGSTGPSDDEYADGNYTLQSADGRTRKLQIKSDGFCGVEMYVEGRRLGASERVVLQNRVSTGALTLAAVEEEEIVAAPGPSISVRKLRARKILDTRLKAMDPEQRETVLSYAALSRDYAPDARAMARKLCEELACPKCDKRVTSGTFCPKCFVEAESRYGVDYLSYRTKLRDARDPLVLSMTAAISDSELRSKKRQESPSSAALPTVPALPKEEMLELTKKLRTECFEALPATLTCTHCGSEHPKQMFGVRVPRRKSDGMPMKPSRIPWCKPCRKGAK